MIGSMQSPWQADLSLQTGDEDYLVETNDRGWMGNMIERSTSAPPISTATKLNFMNVLGSEPAGPNFLFAGSQAHYMGEESSLFRQSSRDSAPPDQVHVPSSSFLAGLRDNTGRAAAPHTGYGDTDALLNSGLCENAGLYRSGSVGAEYSGLGYDENRRIDENIVRSRSAAPSLLSRNSLGPPPGLGMNGNNEDISPSLFGSTPTRSHIMEIGQRRSASTGVLGDPEHYSSLSSFGIESSAERCTVRPAPKTLMDLIQEDIPHDYPHSRPQTAAPYLEREAASYGYSHRPRSISPPQSHIVDSQRGYQAQRREVDPYHQHENIESLNYQMDQLQVGPGQYRQIHGQGQPPQYQHRETAREQQYTSFPVPAHSHRGGHRAQGMNPQMRQLQEKQQVPIYAPARGHGAQLHRHQQHSPPPYDGQPQVYYTSGQHGVQAQQMTHQQPQLQFLPSGQAVYVHAPPQYTYNNVQYHQQAQQSQLVHHSHQQVNSDPHQQYISIMPVAPGGGQVAYWQHQELQVAGMAPAAVIMHPRDGGQQQLSMVHSPQHGRSKGNGHVGMRSPANATGKARGGRGSGRGRGDAHVKNVVGTPLASPLLEEFRATKNRDWTMLDIVGHIVEFCQDQNGSRFIQQRLEVGNPDEQQVVMKEVLPAVRQLRNDVFGNYVVQKLLEFGTPEMKACLRDSLQGEMLPLSLQMYGCRVVQKALETLSEDDLPRLLMEFHHSVLNCIHDQNGNHVIQKCIEVLSTKAKQAMAAKDWARADFFLPRN